MTEVHEECAFVMFTRTTWKSADRLRLILSAATFVVGLVASRSAAADLVFTTPNVSAAPGSVGFFDVNVQYKGSGPTEGVYAFTTTISLPTSSGIALIGADEMTTRPFLFPAAIDSGLGDSLSTIGGVQSLTLFDFTNAPFGDPLPVQPIAPGDVFGLARVFYSVQTTAGPGSYPLLLDPLTPVGTSELDAPSDPNDPFSAPVNVLDGVVSGTIRVGTSPVPEPSTLTAGTTGTAILLLAILWRRLRLRPAPCIA
jgi:hypothetical protein